MATSFCLFVCSSVRLSVACEICKVIRYVAAPGGERALIVSTPIHLLVSVSVTVLVDVRRVVGFNHEQRGDVMEGNLCRDVSMTSYRDLGDAALHHVVDYALSPATMVTHLVMMCLLYGLVVEGGLRRRQLTQLLLGEELLIYVLWLAIDHGLRAPFAIWVCITVYETIAKPQIRYQDHAVLLTGNNNLILFYFITELIKCLIMS